MSDFSKIKLSPGLKYTLRSLPRGKNYHGHVTHSCNVPTRTVTIDSEANCMLCGCEGWLPIPVGKVWDFESLDEVWQSPIATMLQNDIEQKKYTWCAVEHCGVINKNIFTQTYSLNINLDNSCNLTCPSCRRDAIMITDGQEFDVKIKAINQIFSWLEKFPHPIIISLGGSGDALASLIIRRLIKNYQYRPGQKFKVSTNGLLLKKVMPDSGILPAIDMYSISIDAGTKEVYENVRRPGNWEALIENLEWLSENKQKSKVTLNFVVQNANYKDMKAFADLCIKFNFNGSLMPLSDWGTWNSSSVAAPDAWTISNGIYPDHNVADPQHSNHQDFLKELSELKERNLSNLNISSFFRKFL